MKKQWFFALLAAGCALFSSYAVVAGDEPGNSKKKAYFQVDRSYRDIVWQYLETLAGFGPRQPEGTGHAHARELILDVGRKYATAVREQVFSAATAFAPVTEFANIELDFAAGEGKPFILIGAHYDTRPVADEDPDPALRGLPIPGVNDGGSGTALLLGLARYLAAHKPRLPVRLVFFDGEDSGQHSTGYLLGSKHYAAELQKLPPQNWPAAALIVDMVGDKQLEIFQESYSRKSAPKLLDLIYRVARGRFPQFKAEEKFSIIDDHYPFILMNIPAVVLIDFDYPPWHKLADTIENCSPDSLFAVFSVVVETLRHLEGSGLGSITRQPGK